MALIGTWTQPAALLPVSRVCGLLSVSRATLYRQRDRWRSSTEAEPAAQAPAAELMAAIERIVLEFPGYGYRRVTAQLQREGFLVNHKRVLRLMRQTGLLCRLPRRWIRTTDSSHGLCTWPNLLSDCGWRALTGINQAWVADITYVRLTRDFCYLAAILDAYSRRVVGWQLSQHLDAQFALCALEQALLVRQPEPGWIHHSDQGVQYACRAYVETVLSAGGRVSMAAKGTPRENAQAESFIRTLKHEAVYLDEYRTVREAQQGLGHFIEAVYNEKRLHSSLGYRPPGEFEQLLAAGILC